MTKKDVALMRRILTVCVTVGVYDVTENADSKNGDKCAREYGDAE